MMGINSKRNPLSSYIYDSITAFQNEMIHKISKWHVMIAESNIQSETFDKRKISITGVEYSGSIVDLYWSYFEPFIKDYIDNTTEEIRKKAEETSSDAISSLNIFRNNIYNTVEIIYDHIAKSDRAIRGKGFPKKVSLRPVDSEINTLFLYINEKVDAQIDIVRNLKIQKIVKFILEHLDWLLLITLLVVLYEPKKVGFTELCDWLEIIIDKL